MALWTAWWNAIWLLRPAFSRLRTFLWFATAVAGFTVRTELLGVTSLVRALKIEARFYNKLVDHFHSPAVTRWCTKPWESTITSSGPASSRHAEVSGTSRDGWRHCRPVGRVAPSFHASIWEAHAIQVQ